MSKKYKLVFEFPSSKSREEFIAWLSESGEQDFLYWCEIDFEERPCVTFSFPESNDNNNEVTIRTEKYPKTSQ